MADVTAALITAKETVTFRTFSPAPPPSGCVTVSISLCGICGTDISSFRTGHLHSPAVCGHEWVGTVADAGPGVDGLREGDRVLLAVPPACGRVSLGRGRGEAPQPRTTSGPCGGPSGTKAFPATVERLDQFAGIPATITSVVIAERRPR